MDDLKTEHIFGLQETSMSLFLTCYPWVILQPGTGRRPIDW